MAKLPILALSPDDPVFAGRVVSYSTPESDATGKQYVLVLETLTPCLGFHIGQRVQFFAPSNETWETAIREKLVAIRRVAKEGSRIARYEVTSLGNLGAQQGEVTVAGMMRGKEVSAHVAGAYELAAKVATWFNKRHPDLTLAGREVSALAHTLMIAHQRGEIHVPPFNGDDGS